MEIKKAVYEDIPTLFDLQKLSFISEAELLNDYSIQPLVQTIKDVENEFSKYNVLKLMDDKNGRIIGSVRAREENGRVYIARLFVHPDYRNRGLGAELLNAIESFYEGKTFELFTSSKSERNLHLYKKNGYREYKREKATDNYDYVYLEKSKYI